MADATSHSPAPGPSVGESVAWNQPCSSKKWRGGVHLVLNCSLDAAWCLQSDFMGLHKWVPVISENRLEEGEANALGCLRYCKGSGTTWVRERLLEIDEAWHYMSYRMEDNHFVFPKGFQGYVSKVQLGETGEGQTWVNWTYEVNPVLSATQEDVAQFMKKFYSKNLQYLEEGAQKLAMAGEISEATAQNPQGDSATTSRSQTPELPSPTTPVPAL